MRWECVFRRFGFEVGVMVGSWRFWLLECGCFGVGVLGLMGSVVLGVRVVGNLDGFFGFVVGV